MQLQALRSPSAPSGRRAQTADTLRAVRCFPSIAEARLGPSDSLDAKVPDAEFDATAAAVGGGGVEVDEQVGRGMRGGGGLGARTAMGGKRALEERGGVAG